MSQPRMRKASSTGAQPAPRARVAVEASGDAAPCEPPRTLRPNERTDRSASKNKIPKSIRYDLENALVGLCNVWFEEIKPHLMRNNIKVHMHEAEAGGDHTHAPPAAPHCTHLHPGAASDSHRPAGASCASCCSTRPTASKAPSRRPAQLAPPFPQPHTRSTLPTSHHSNTQNDCTLCEAPAQRPRRRRKPRQPLPLFQSYWLKPRLNRTRSTMSPHVTSSVLRSKTRTVLSSSHTCGINYTRPIRKPKLKHTSTQTEVTKLPVKKPATSPPARFLNSPIKCTKSPIRCPKSPTQCLKSPNQCLEPPARCRKSLTRCLKSPTVCHPRSPTPRSTQHKVYAVQKQLRISESRPLFSYDLIDIIGDSYDDRLRLLYKSPVRHAESSSIMNLMLCSANTQSGHGGVIKKPWR